MREISKNGEIARLTSFDAPAEKAEPVEEIDVSMISEPIKTKLEKLSKTGEKGEKFEIDGSTDKIERTAIHRAVKHLFKNLETKTVGDKIEVSRPKNQRKDKRDRGKPNQNYRFVLWKEFMDSTVALDHICRQLRANQKAFHTAGTKDKRAVTAQFVTTYLKPKALLGLNRSLKNVKIGNIEIHQDKE